MDSDLAQEHTKYPYNFAFTGITKPYNEHILKDALFYPEKVEGAKPTIEELEAKLGENNM